MWTINRRTISPKTHAHLLTESDYGAAPRVTRVELSDDKVDVLSLTDDEIIAIALLVGQDRGEALRLPPGHRVGARRRPAVRLRRPCKARPETVWSKKRHSVRRPHDGPDGLDRRHPRQVAVRQKGGRYGLTRAQHSATRIPSDSNPPRRKD